MSSIEANETARAAMDLDDGYVREIEYTHGYCGDLAPSIIDLACLSRGVAPPLGRRPLRYLELAFGQGVSVNIHAAASGGEFWGIDYNPAHAANARDLANASGSGARLSGESLESFAARADVPQFDAIALHGTWSWVAQRNRDLVVDIVRRSLAPGGAFFVSYNCLAGWATQLPLRHLLVQHAALAATPGQRLEDKIDAALRFARALADAGAKYFDDHAEVSRWLDDMCSRSRSYLAHEYFNRDWHPMPSADVAGALAAANLTFAASATVAENTAGAGLSEEGRAVLAGIRHPVMRETAGDYLVNRLFRRDIFLRGPSMLAPAARDERLGNLPFVLLQHPDHVPATMTVAGTETALPPEVRRPFVEVLALDGYAPKTLRQVGSHPDCRAIGFERLVEMALLLTSAGAAHPAQPQTQIETAAPRCRALNTRILERACLGGNASFLASPVTGAGLFVARQEMLFLRSIALGHLVEDEWARHASGFMPASDPAVLQSNARAFARIRLPVLKALRVA